MLDALRSALLRHARRRMPAPLPDEVRLFADADAFLDAHPAFDPSADALRALARLHGLDLATAVFCRAMRRRHATFCAAVDAPLPSRLPRVEGHLLVVPAFQHDTLPGYGGDGALARRAAEALGMTTSVAALPPFDLSEPTADCLADAVASAPQGPVWLVSLSKGGTDVRALADHRPEAFGRVAAWVSVCGILHGTPLGAVVAPWKQRAVAAALGVPYAGLAALASDGPLAAPFAVPPHVRAVSLVGCPTAGHFTTGSGRRQHAALAPEGPNDGMIRLAEGVVPGSAVYTVWGADHFFRTPFAAHLLYGVFRALAHALTETPLPAAPNPAPARPASVQPAASP